MMQPRYEQERQVTAVIDRRHQDAHRAGQLKLARGNRPSPIDVMGTSIRASVGALMATLHSLFIHDPSTVVEPAMVPEPVDDPASYGDVASPAQPVENPATV